MNLSPTKSNLMNCQHSLALAKLGYDLMDRKRNIMMREMTQMIDRAAAVQRKIDAAFSEAYDALMRANMTVGQNTVRQIAESVSPEDDMQMLYRSVMGIELPDVTVHQRVPKLDYGFRGTSSMLDEAYLKFRELKVLTAEAAAVENSVQRLARAIKQSKKRANALHNIVIPRLEEEIRYITEYLEEKERDEFSILKVLKQNKQD